MRKILRLLMLVLIVGMLTSAITLIFYYEGDSVDKVHFTDDMTETKKTSTSTSSTDKKNDTKEEVEEVVWTKSETPINFPILMYHHIAEVVDENTLYVPESEFKMEMEALKEAGYYTLSPDEAYRVLTQNEKPAEKIVWVTFDDGYLDNYQAAVPILNELKMKGTINIITSMRNGDNSMTDAQLQELSQNPLISLESHTVNHIDLEYTTVDEQSLELAESKQSLEQLIGKEITTICYPAGRYSDDTISLAESSGYKLGLTTNGGLAGIEDGLLSLSRVRIAYGHTKESFLNQISPEMWGLSE